MPTEQKPFWGFDRSIGAASKMALDLTIVQAFIANCKRDLSKGSAFLSAASLHSVPSGSPKSFSCFKKPPKTDLYSYASFS